MTITIEQARAIPLYVLMHALGGKYPHSDRQPALVFSPFWPRRPTEKIASFKINDLVVADLIRETLQA